MGVKPGKQPLRGPGKRIVVQPRRFCGVADVEKKAVKKKKKAKRTGREQKPSVSRAGQRLKQAFHELPNPFRPTSGLAAASPSFSDASDTCTSFFCTLPLCPAFQDAFVQERRL